MYSNSTTAKFKGTTSAISPPTSLPNYNITNIYHHSTIFTITPTTPIACFKITPKLSPPISNSTTTESIYPPTSVLKSNSTNIHHDNTISTITLTTLIAYSIITPKLSPPI